MREPRIYSTRRIEGYEVKEPLNYPVSLNEFLRLVVGGTIASARTETDRLRYYRRFLQCDSDSRKKAGQPGFDVNQIITEKRKRQFGKSQFWSAANSFISWRQSLLTDRARTAAKKRWSKSLTPKQVTQASA